LTDQFLEHVDYLIANEIEADRLGSVTYRGIAIITAAERGVQVLVPGHSPRTMPALSVPVVDTTAAGDAFCGCFAASIANGRTRVDALRRAIAAGAQTVTTNGAYSSLPFAEDVETRLRQASEAQN
jgi:ribokinase